MVVLFRHHIKNIVQLFIRCISKSFVFLYSVAFFFSIIFPIPPDIFLLPLALANPRLAFRMALFITIFSVFGGLVGYFIGLLFYQQFGYLLLSWFGTEDLFAEFSEKYNAYGGLAVFIGGLTPIPYKLVAILSGTTAMPIIEFLTASILARGLRFFFIAIIIYFFNKAASRLIKKYLNLLMIPIILLTIIGYLIIKIL